MSEIVIIGAGESVACDPLGAGLAYGFGLFETIEYADGCLSFWAAHWQRLQTSATTFGLNCDFEEVAVLKAVADLVVLDGLGHSMIKLSLLRVGVSTKLYVYARPVAAIPKTIQLKLEERYPMNPRSLLSGHKTHNYMEHSALLEAARAGDFYDALRLDVDGYLAETTIGNLFFIRNGQVCTPAQKHGVLPGVIRGALIEACNVEEGSYRPSVLQDAEAVFMTNSGAGVLPVARIVGAGIDQSYDSAGHPKVLVLIEALAREVTASRKPVV